MAISRGYNSDTKMRKKNRDWELCCTVSAGSWQTTRESEKSVEKRMAQTPVGENPRDDTVGCGCVLDWRTLVGPQAEPPLLQNVCWTINSPPSTLHLILSRCASLSFSLPLCSCFVVCSSLHGARWEKKRRELCILPWNWSCARSLHEHKKN